MIFLVVLEWAAILAASLVVFAIVFIAAVIIGTLLLYAVIMIVALVTMYIIQSIVWIGEQLSKSDIGDE